MRRSVARSRGCINVLSVKLVSKGEKGGILNSAPPSPAGLLFGRVGIFEELRKARQV